MKFFRRTARYPLSDYKRKEEIFVRAKVEPVDEKLKKIQIKLATTCNKNEQDAKNNAEL
jgi:hypothetical protein